MSTAWWSTWLLAWVILIPALAALALGWRSIAHPTRSSGPRWVRVIASGAAVLGLGASVLAAWAAIDALARQPRPRSAGLAESSSPALVLQVPWIPALGVQLRLVLDEISLPLLLLTAVLVLLVVSRELSVPEPNTALLACIFAVQAAASATFLAGDLLVFFVAFESVLVPMWLIIARWGDDRDLVARRNAANRFALFTVTGSALMMLGIVLIWMRTGTTDLSILGDPAGPGLSGQDAMLAASLLTLGLAVKTPMFPLHTWLPAAHTTAPTSGSVLLAGVLLKMGTYGLVRVVLGVVPGGLADIAPVVGAFAVAGIFWAAWSCFAERDLKRLIAYSSIAHMGFIVLGIASMTPVGVQGALFANIGHGVISALLFLIAGALKDRYHTTTIAELGRGLRDRLPRLGWVLLVSALAALGLPGLAGFWGEMLAISGAWSSSALDVLARPLAVLAAFGAIPVAAYLLRVLRQLWQGGDPAEAASEVAGDLTRAETTVLAPLLAALVILGLVPGVLLNLTGPAVRAILGVLS